MRLREHEEAEIDCREDWPRHYYEITDIDQRENILKEMLETLPAMQEENLRRLEILQKRYPQEPRIQGKRRDNFIAAWMLLMITGRTGVNFLNRKRTEREIRSCLRDFGLLDFPQDDLLRAEWRDFAALWIRTCAQDKAYSSTAFGMLRLKDSTLAEKILSEINEVTLRIPQKFGLEQKVLPLREIMLAAFSRMIPNAQEFLSSALD